MPRYLNSSGRIALAVQTKIWVGTDGKRFCAWSPETFDEVSRKVLSSETGFFEIKDMNGNRYLLNVNRIADVEEI